MNSSGQEVGESSGLPPVQPVSLSRPTWLDKYMPTDGGAQDQSTAPAWFKKFNFDGDKLPQIGDAIFKPQGGRIPLQGQDQGMQNVENSAQNLPPLPTNGYIGSTGPPPQLYPPGTKYQQPINTVQQGGGFQPSPGGSYTGPIQQQNLPYQPYPPSAQQNQGNLQFQQNPQIKIQQDNLQFRPGQTEFVPGQNSSARFKFETPQLTPLHRPQLEASSSQLQYGSHQGSRQSHVHYTESKTPPTIHNPPLHPHLQHAILKDYHFPHNEIDVETVGMAHENLFEGHPILKYDYQPPTNTGVRQALNALHNFNQFASTSGNISSFSDTTRVEGSGSISNRFPFMEPREVNDIASSMDNSGALAQALSKGGIQGSYSGKTRLDPFSAKPAGFYGPDLAYAKMLKMKYPRANITESERKIPDSVASDKEEPKEDETKPKQGKGSPKGKGGKKGGAKSPKGGAKSPKGGAKSPKGGAKSPKGGAKSPKGGKKSPAKKGGKK